jgi:ABC-type amino acid transport substrate-binding protein
LSIAPSNANENSNCLDLHVIANAPIGYINQHNIHQGVHWDYLLAIEKESNLCLNKTLLPYARIWQSIRVGKHDGGIIFKSNSRSNIVEYVAPIRSVKTVVVPLKGISIKSYADLRHIIIGKTRGTHLSKKFDSDKNLQIVELNNYQQAAKMIEHGRIDAIAGSALVISYQLNKYNMFTHVDIDNKWVLGEKEQWLQLSSKSSHLDKTPQLKEAIEKLQKNGSFDKIMNKYYGDKWKEINQ